MSRAKPAYAPRPDSLPARLIAFFGRNPDEALSLEDITEKFDVSRGHIHTMLALAKDAGMLELGKDEDGAYVYTAGKHLPRTHPDVGVIIEHGWAVATPDKAKATRKAATPGAPHAKLPSAADIVFDDTTPLPNIRGNLDTDYTSKLKELRPDSIHNFALPLAAKHALVKQIVALHKAQQGRYTTRVNQDKQEVRVWRTA